MKYKAITIEQAEQLYNNNVNIICDADKQEITLDGTTTDIINSLTEAFKKVVETINKIGKKILQVFNRIKEYITKLFNKKISKKKFIKLLQSKGLQRNDINRIIKNNKEKYTMWRYISSIPPNL
ncbi:MAG: hypothetical protein HFJ47_00090 [Clostridia bacterium]|nr:hypothetical protein [Clostridia bacterium]